MATRKASKRTWRSSAFCRPRFSSTNSLTTPNGPLMASLNQELRAFIVDTFLFGDESTPFAFSDDDSFQERGIVDSTGILELVCHLQERYGIDITDTELVPDNLDSVSQVARFVERKQREQAIARAS